MQSLLTKGIGHTKFKKTSIGEIPAGWELSILNDVSMKIIDMDHKMPKKTDSGIPFLSVGYLTKKDTPFLDIRKGDGDLEYISEE